MQTSLLNDRVNGKRGRGRPRTSWTSKFREWTGKSYTEAVRLTSNRCDWRTIARNSLQEDETWWWRWRRRWWWCSWPVIEFVFSSSSMASLGRLSRLARTGGIRRTLIGLGFRSPGLIRNVNGRDVQNTALSWQQISALSCRSVQISRTCSGIDPLSLTDLCALWATTWGIVWYCIIHC